MKLQRKMNVSSTCKYSKIYSVDFNLNPCIMLSYLHFFFSSSSLFLNSIFIFGNEPNNSKADSFDQLTSPLMTICTDKLLLQTDMVKKKANCYNSTTKGSLYRVKGHLGGMFLGWSHTCKEITSITYNCVKH